MAFLPEDFKLVFDTDYIFEWIRPKPGETHFKFWVAQATLVFENVYDVEFDADSYNGKLEIDSISREGARAPHNVQSVDKEIEWLWIIECQKGEIRFRSVVYKQFIREAPRLGKTQAVDL